MPRFYSEPIEVVFRTHPGPPTAFIWRGEEHRIAAVEAMWQDHGVGTVNPKYASWRLRRHRNYYRVRTDDGRTFEFYLDRSGGRRRWVLYREL